VEGAAAVSAVVLDTHAWVWWISKPEKLSRRQRAAIDRARKRGGDALLLSIISGWEVALLVQGGRLRLPVPLETWLEQAMSVPRLDIVPLTVPVIGGAARLTVLRDPADMLIVATALQHGARVITNDARIADSGLVQVIG
jgi:PIN domain nuclease of toxin-antitoxin system